MREDSGTAAQAAVVEDGRSGGGARLPWCVEGPRAECGRRPVLGLYALRADAESDAGPIEGARVRRAPGSFDVVDASQEPPEALRKGASWEDADALRGEAPDAVVVAHRSPVAPALAAVGACALLAAAAAAYAVSGPFAETVPEARAPEAALPADGAASRVLSLELDVPGWDYGADGPVAFAVDGAGVVFEDGGGQDVEVGTEGSEVVPAHALIASEDGRVFEAAEDSWSVEAGVGDAALSLSYEARDMAGLTDDEAAMAAESRDDAVAALEAVNARRDEAKAAADEAEAAAEESGGTVEFDPATGSYVVKDGSGAVSSAVPSSPSGTAGGSGASSAPSPSEGASSGATSGGAAAVPEAPAHVHDYSVPVTSSVWVVDSPAWDEPVYQYVDWCNKCGCQVPITHNEDMRLAGQYGHTMSAKQVQTGTVHHDEAGHYEERVVGYRCSCGASA